MAARLVLRLAAGRTNKTIVNSASAPPTPFRGKTSMFALPAANQQHQLHKAKEAFAVK